MEKIINGKKYSTKTAKEIASQRNGFAVNDFHFCEETLYQKKTGEFFIYGCGNGLSKYAKKEFDGWTRGEKIVPLTEEEAKKWAEESLSADEYEVIFGECEE